jgi:serine/threonine-protein kinase
VDAAILAYREAIRLDPKDAMPYGGLGQALLGRGRFAEAQETTLKCLALLPTNNAMRPYIAKLLHYCKQALALDQRASAILERRSKAKNPSELLRLARFCLDQKGAPAAAAQLYADAFAAEPALADDLTEGDRFVAAQAAALAGCGKGNDAATVDEAGRIHWRKQALDWLRADLKLWTKRQTSGDADDRDEVRQALERWRRAPHLAGLRDRDSLAKLPAEERAAWQSLWADVDTLLAQGRERNSPASR